MALAKQRMAKVEPKVAGFGIAEGLVSPTSSPRSGIRPTMGETLGGLVVPPGAGIIGQIDYMNHLIPEGTETWGGFLLGRIEGETIYLYYFTHEGVDYFIGSLASFSIVPPESSSRVDVPSVAAFTNPVDLPYWDAWVWVGTLTGPIRTLVVDTRVIGIRREDLDFISPHDVKAFEDVLRVVLASEVTGFEMATG